MFTETSLPKSSRFKFGLVHLFYATALIASGLALSSGTIWFSIFVLVFWTVVFGFLNLWKCLLGRLTGSDSFVSILALFILLTFLIAMAMPEIGNHSSYRRVSCLNNLRQTIIAMHNYETAFLHFPSDRIVITPDGTHLRHSWRISILRDIEEGALYDSYDFNEPWNGPNNSKLADKMPEIWRCTSSPKKKSNLTPYKLVNGPGTAFELGKRVTTTTVLDGLSNTIAMIEDGFNPVHWMEPTDLTAEEAARILNSNIKRLGPHVEESLFERRYFGPNFAMLDGSTNGLAMSPKPPIDKGAFLISDGVPFDSATPRDYRVEIKYHAYFVLGIYLVLILFPVVCLLTRTPNVA